MMHFRDSRIVCYLTRRDILAAAGLVPVEPVCFARDMMVVASRSTPLVAMNSAVSGVPASPIHRSLVPHLLRRAGHTLRLLSGSLDL